jgi:hypothetical protein
MRRKIGGYILQFTRSDNDGRHIHIYEDAREPGVYDRLDGPTRGLEAHWGKSLREAVEELDIATDTLLLEGAILKTARQKDPLMRKARKAGLALHTWVTSKRKGIRLTPPRSRKTILP